MPKIEMSQDAHSRVAVLFVLERDDKGKPTLMSVSVQWILAHGQPVHPLTNLKMEYHGTYIIQ